ncbi:MAG: sodium/solute symporter [Planctomycetota bacterium]
MGELIGGLDILVFVVFVVSVIALGLYKSRVEAVDHHKKKTGEDYFLAGRGLSWWLVGFSLIAANISTEQFVGMSGKAADWLGMAIASYEWMAAITLVFVAFVFLPKFLRSGIFTIPEFLEYRYNTFARTIMAVSTLIILVGVPTASVIYSGAKVICVFFQGQTLMGFDLGSITVGCWIIGILATVYVFVGGLKACAWADLIQGAALIVGGGVIAYYAFQALGGADVSTLASVSGEMTAEQLDQLSSAGALERFKLLNGGALPEGKLHMFRPPDDPEIPWTALMLGLWIPNFFYWGLNQYITQRTLGSKSLSEGQKGVVFAALLKLIIPFVVVIPGMLAFNLFSEKLRDEAVRNNEETVAIYEENKANPSTAKVVFRFNDEFVKYNSVLAEELLAFNASVLGVDVDTSLEIVEANASVVAQIDSYNEGKTEDETIKVQTELTGRDYDAAFPILLGNLMPVGRGILGFVLAAIFGAVVSSLASMLNSASTIATMDVYNKLRKGASSQLELVTTGRVFVVLFVLVALWIAPNLGSPAFGGIFTFIQEFQGFISPGILTVFIFGLLIHKAPRVVGTVGLLLNPVLYGLFKFSPSIPVLKNVEILQTVAAWSFLNRMALCFVILIIVLTIITLIKPLPKPVELPVNTKMDMTPSKSTKVFGGVVIALTIILYIIFF